MKNHHSILRSLTNSPLHQILVLLLESQGDYLVSLARELEVVVVSFREVGGRV